MLMHWREINLLVTFEGVWQPKHRVEDDSCSCDWWNTDGYCVATPGAFALVMATPGVCAAAIELQHVHVRVCRVRVEGDLAHRNSI